MQCSIIIYFPKLVFVDKVAICHFMVETLPIVCLLDQSTKVLMSEVVGAIFGGTDYDATIGTSLFESLADLAI